MKHSSEADNRPEPRLEVYRDSALSAFISLTPVRLHGAGGNSTGAAPETLVAPPPISLPERPESLHKLPIAELRSYLNAVVTACLAGEDIGLHLSFITEEGKIIQGIGRKTEEAIQEEVREAAVAEARIKALRSWIADEIYRVREGEQTGFDPAEAKAAHTRLLAEKDQCKDAVRGLDKLHDQNAARMAEITRALGRITRHVGAEIEFDGLTGNMFDVC